MPIYEFYCRNCNTVYKFFSRSVNTEKVPDCPNCEGATLVRQVSLFAAISERKGAEASDADLPDDASKMEKALSLLEAEAGKLNEDDPRQTAGLMRRLSDTAGISMGPGMEEALSRLEQGEDPDRIEEEMGDILEKEDPFIHGTKAKRAGRKAWPRVDERLYDL